MSLGICLIVSSVIRLPFSAASAPGPDLAPGHGPNHDAFILVNGEVLQLTANPNLVAMDPVMLDIANDEQGANVLAPGAVNLDHITDLNRSPVSLNRR